MKNYKPTFTFTNKICDRLFLIGKLLSKLEHITDWSKFKLLTNTNMIKSIKSSIAIENNTLSLQQVIDVINGNEIEADKRQITEAQNCFNAYDCLAQIDSYSIKDLLTAHSIMVKYLCKEAGMFRKTDVGVFAGTTPIHIAPKPLFVPKLIEQLFEWIKTTDTNFIIASCVFHFEFEFIHPFADGNGRMGRLWQKAILSKHIQLFKYLPIEETIWNSRQNYYHALQKSQNEGNSTFFVEYMVNVIYDTLLKFKNDIDSYIHDSHCEQIDKLLKVIDNVPKTSKEIMKILKLKNQPSFYYNYLKPAIEANLIKLTCPNKPKSKNQKYYK